MVNNMQPIETRKVAKGIDEFVLQRSDIYMARLSSI